VRGFEAPTAIPGQPTEAAAELGRTIQKVGGTVAQVANAAAQSELRIKAEENENDALQRFNKGLAKASDIFNLEIFQDGGPDADQTLQPMERLTTGIADVLDEVNADASPEVAELVNAKMDKHSQYWIQSMSQHQIKKMRSDRTKHTAQALNEMGKAVFNDEKSFEINRLAAIDAIDAQGLTGEDREEAIVKAEDSLATSAMRGMISRQPQTAKAVLDSGLMDQYFKDVDTKPKLQKLASAQAKSNQDAAEAADKKQRQDTERQMALLLAGEKLTPLQAATMSANAGLSGDDTAKWVNRAEKKQDEKFTKSEPRVYAAMLDRVTNDPESVDQDDIEKLIGKGLGTKDATDLISQLGQEAQAQDKEVLSQFKAAYKSGAFGKYKKGKTFPETDEEYSKQLRVFRRWRRANPKGDAVDYRKRIMTEVDSRTRKRLMSSLNLTGEVSDIALRRQAEARSTELRLQGQRVLRVRTDMLDAISEAGKERKPNSPDPIRYIRTMREANPDASDQQIWDAYLNNWTVKRGE
jgi:hypothetical protein